MCTHDLSAAQTCLSSLCLLLCLHLNICIFVDVVRIFTNLSLSADTVPSAAEVQVTFDPVVLLFVFVMAAFVT